MIHKLGIENFYSIADAQELTFRVPQNAPDLPCFKKSNSDSSFRLPSVIGFFGANASGKTNVIRAIISAVVFACNSFDSKAFELSALFQPYRQQEWWHKPSKISIEFEGRLNENMPLEIFRYELHIGHQAEKLFNDRFVEYEMLSYSPKGKSRRLFERHEQIFKFGKEFNIQDHSDPRIASIRSNASVLSTLAKFNHKLATDLVAQLQLIQGSIAPNDMNQILSIYENDKECFEELNRELRRLGIGLESMSIEPSSQGLFATFQHARLDQPILFNDESTGTQRFIENFWRLFIALKKGGVVVIDELDIHLHPLLLPEIFRWFYHPDRNPHGAQLIFTAHNAALLNELEKEQVYFAEKTIGHASHVYGARDIKGLRREPSLLKKYLSGELGAVPHIG